MLAQIHAPTGYTQRASGVWAPERTGVARPPRARVQSETWIQRIGRYEIRRTRRWIINPLTGESIPLPLQMAIVATQRDSTDDTAAPFESVSLSGLTNGQLCVVAVMAQTSGGTDTWATTFTLSGCGQTWTGEESTNFTDASQYGGRLKTFYAVLASFSAGVLTAAGTGTAPNGVAFKVTTFSDIDSSGTIVQSVANSGTGTAVTTTLSAFGSSSNACYLTVAGGSMTASRDHTYATLTELGVDLDDDTQAFCTISHAWQVGEDLSPDCTLSGSANWAAHALEIKATGGATPARIGGLVDTGLVSTGLVNGGLVQA